MPYQELKTAIKNKGMRADYVAKQIGVSGKVLSDRMRGRSEWKAVEIYRIRDILGLSWREVESIFFADK